MPALSEQILLHLHDSSPAPLSLLGHFRQRRALIVRLLLGLARFLDSKRIEAACSLLELANGCHHGWGQLGWVDANELLLWRHVILVCDSRVLLAASLRSLQLHQHFALVHHDLFIVQILVGVLVLNAGFGRLMLFDSHLIPRRCRGHFALLLLLFVGELDQLLLRLYL